MTDKHRKYLTDILIAIGKIEAFTTETGSFHDYDSDFKVQSAVERQLGIVGEALNSYAKLGGCPQ